MGCYRRSGTKSRELLNHQIAPASDPVANQHCDYENEVKFRTLLQKMIWEFGLSCFVNPGGGRGIEKREEEENENNQRMEEHNKAWLLAESGGCGPELASTDPQSVHSSFRFSLCSQVELESMNVNSNPSSATVLMLNLDNGLMDPLSKEMKWRRIESLERRISPVARSLIRFTFPEILSATRSFSKGRVLGRGALSCVFRGRVGILRNAVAIKRLDKEDKESSKAFCRELMIASSLHHSNIVPLLGFCIDAEEGFFLVYNYVSGGSLEHFLHEKKRSGVKRNRPSLPWSARYKIAIGIAEAIGYLHNGNERCVVHRDIKPSNILLSSNKIPKVCDFGLATWTNAPSSPFLCKTVKGTFGYLAPEYFQHGKVSDKTDVYAFGVVLLELISGRKPIESRRGTGEENLVAWAKSMLEKGSAEKLYDSRLRLTRKSMIQVAKMVQAAAVCINSEESQRPSIDGVIRILRSGEENNNKFSDYVDNNCYSQSHNQRNGGGGGMSSHFALAMLGVSDLEDDDNLYCR
ncbi:probable serine/threonine-protein kinase PBL7 [Impatiens glandulifera]|uniref:probable serine/threonine-protein kinase PBL7 n=1 Tax=Impatiens glandulifera TaxID=253017 RepID=UPI001FB090A0|nr:probable serine/threonine-protein kinase PBL7 [Impatiens glandulifera]